MHVCYATQPRAALPPDNIYNPAPGALPWHIITVIVLPRKPSEMEDIE